jgi:hypothetical protein
MVRANEELARGNMNNDVDFDLSPDQWEALRALRHPPANGSLSRAYLVEGLVELGLVVVDHGIPLMTQEGRRVLVRGSCRLLDVAA